MALAGVLVTFSILLIIVLMMFYILIIGRIGVQIFKYNFPLFKKRGTFYLIWLRSGRFKWVYDKFKTKWEWPDGTITYISKKFDRLAQSVEPLVFLVEGFPTNIQLGDYLPKEEMSKLINNIIKEAESTARLEEQLIENKPKLFDKVIPIATLVFVILSLVLSMYLLFTLGDLTKILTDIKPHIPAAIEALKSAADRTI